MLDDQRKGAVFRTKKLFQIALVRVRLSTKNKHIKSQRHTKTQEPREDMKTHGNTRKNTKNTETTQKIQKTHTH